MESDSSQWLDILRKRKNFNKFADLGSEFNVTIETDESINDHHIPFEEKLDRLVEFLRKTDENFVFFFDNVDTLIKKNT